MAAILVTGSVTHSESAMFPEQELDGTKMKTRLFLLNAAAFASLSAVCMPIHAAEPQPSRSIAVNVQEVSPTGLVLRVNAVELEQNSTKLQIHAAYSGRKSGYVNLAALGTRTYLQTESGQQLPVQPPKSNRYLRVKYGEPMDEPLVFLGAIPEDTKILKLVLNEPDADSAMGASLGPMAEQLGPRMEIEVRVGG